MKFLPVRFMAFPVISAAFVTQPIVEKRETRTGYLSQHRPVLSLAKNAETNEVIGLATEASSQYEQLGLPARPGRPLKVAIAGGGVGGLTAALCMLKKGFDVQVYEKTAAFARFGGPIQFASNALSVLKEIDDRLFDRVMDKFTFTGTRACGIKDGRSHVEQLS